PWQRQQTATSRVDCGLCNLDHLLSPVERGYRTVLISKPQIGEKKVTSVVDLQEMAFNNLDELCSSLSADEWDATTDCPGWSVKDNLSHIIGTEATILGRPAPAHDPGEKPWIRNPIGASNEIHVDYRRSRTPAEVLDEFREVTGERMKVLRSMSESDLD